MKNLKQFCTLSLLGLSFFSLSSFVHQSARELKRIEYVSPEFKPNDANYCVKLAETKKSLSVRLTQKITNVRGARGIQLEDGTFQFFSPYFPSESELEKAYSYYLEMGFGNAEKMVEYQGAFYTLSQFESVKSGF